jgi:hypothetical protein
MDMMDENVLRAATENFNLPHDVIKLPTQGIFYKSKKSSVKVGYLTANDENYLMSNNNKEHIVMTLLRNKLYEHDLRPEELIESDVEAILLFLRNSSFGPEYKLNLIDPKTSKIFEHTEIIDNLTLKETTVKPDSDGTFTTKLPKTGVMVKLKPITFFDTVEMDKLGEKYPKGITVPIVTNRLNKEIVSVDGNEDIGYISQFISTLPIMDSKYIKTYLKENVPQIDLKRQTYAPSGELVTFSVSFGVDFFRPFF